MKRLNLVFITLLLSFFAFAERVNEAEAWQIATNFMNAPVVNTAGKRVARIPRRFIKMNQQIVPSQNFYVFNSTDGNGFLIVSADDVARPILGYSDSGTIDVSNMPENMRWWLSQYNVQIKWAQDNNISASEEITEEWNKYRTGTATASTVVVGPLLSTEWDQGTPYNNMCPMYSASQHAATGCAATAAAQIMNYHQWPTQGTGSKTYTTATRQYQLSADFGATTYDWFNMKDSYSGNYSPAQANAVATLMYHVGVASNMDYAVDATGESGAKNKDVGYGLTHYFGYSKELNLISRDLYSSESWTLTILNQLNKNLPVFYGGNSSETGGHAFVCDGYRSDFYFHFNWGWGGISDGYYPLEALTPTSAGIGSGNVHDYTADQTAIVNIIPDTASANYSLQLANTLIWPNLDFFSLDTITQGDSVKKLGMFINSGKLPFAGKIYLAALHQDDLSHGYFLDSFTNIYLEPFSIIDVMVEDSEHFFDRVASGMTAHNFQSNETSEMEEGDYLLTFLYKDTINNINGGVGADYDANIAYLHVKPLTTIRAKIPTYWGNTIRVWVWYDGSVGFWDTPVQNGEWYEYQNSGHYNIIYVNGNNWNGDNNQTVDIAVSSDMCIQIDNNTSGKRTYTNIDCPADFHYCQSLPYSEPFSSSQGDFTIENVNLDNLNYVWAYTSGYGMKASAYVGQTYHATESWLISPCLEFPEESTINMSFDHVCRYTSAPRTQLTLLVSENYVSGDSSLATWTEISIPTYSTGNNWTFVNSGNIDLSSYSGKNVTLAFRYISTTTEAATWEIKNINLTATSIITNIDEVEEGLKSIKLFEDGKLFILLPDGTKYSATGRKVE